MTKKMFEPKNRQRSYVGAYYDSNNDAVIVWERDEDGKRVVKPYHAPHYFYVPDTDGEYTTIFGNTVKKLSFDTKDEFNDALRQHRERYESDISPMFRVLMDEYYDSVIPRVHYSFVDIETDYSSELGFSDPTHNPYAEINAVTVWQSWTNKYITIALLPNGLKKRFKRAKFDAFIARIAAKHGLLATPDVQIATNEAELLQGLVDAIEDADIISGWNSEFFDLPYIIKRLERIRPRLVPRLCFTGCRPPREKTVERFGTPSIVYSLNGRTHLDYLDLFKKFTFEGRTSYSLGAITGDELDSPKMEHEGSLEQLFHGTYNPPVDEEFVTWDQIDELRETELERLTMRRAFLIRELDNRERGIAPTQGLHEYNVSQLKFMFDEVDDDVLHCSFATFCGYNTHDVGCLVGLDKKFKFIDLVNQMAHENTVLFENMTGTVRYVETGIANRAHYTHQQVVMDKKVMTDGEKVEGALVLDPLAGLHKWIGSVDINSLYPSVIRSLCISPEKFVAQFANGEADWRGIRDGDDREHTCLDDEGETITLTGKEWQEVLRENKWALSAYGTIFDQSAGMGIVDETLAFWYAERKRLKKIMGTWVKKQKELAKDAIMIFTKEESALIKKKDQSMQEVLDMIASGEFFFKDGHLYDPAQWTLYHEYQAQIDAADLLQLTKKIQL